MEGTDEFILGLVGQWEPGLVSEWPSCARTALNVSSLNTKDFNWSILVFGGNVPADDFDSRFDLETKQLHFAHGATFCLVCTPLSRPLTRK